MTQAWISAPKVMRSPAGYYIGREFKEMGEAVPYDRLTDYFPTRIAAEHVLQTFIYLDPRRK
ncbi:hypothetical protein [Jeotgalibacillus terrae]|uniref:Uncharacterized protein n=1 Tax=Jeotgalibacillus terrae TaxID=587735 RepID=A0ABW5ZK38_9BACL|nr:hypothetical protein [Jeotgalibacillus terrae]MBM7580813.1 hypothetical protein [Jeotgalibacillus terrae]